MIRKTDGSEIWVKNVMLLRSQNMAIYVMQGTSCFANTPFVYPFYLVNVHLNPAVAIRRSLCLCSWRLCIKLICQSIKILTYSYHFVLIFNSMQCHNELKSLNQIYLVPGIETKILRSWTQRPANFAMYFHKDYAFN